ARSKRLIFVVLSKIIPSVDLPKRLKKKNTSMPSKKNFFLSNSLKYLLKSADMAVFKYEKLAAVLKAI
ncbi:hypothetical protein CDAR_208391, partial [Caerostris darwini]